MFWSVGGGSEWKVGGDPVPGGGHACINAGESVPATATPPTGHTSDEPSAPGVPAHQRSSRVPLQAEKAQTCQKKWTFICPTFNQTPETPVWLPNTLLNMNGDLTSARLKPSVPKVTRSINPFLAALVFRFYTDALPEAAVLLECVCKRRSSTVSMLPFKLMGQSGTSLSMMSLDVQINPERVLTRQVSMPPSMDPAHIMLAVSLRPYEP